ncbi:hypothetical protein [Streptomyces sp. NPDC059631]|uniref:hypothetical protein n=1 Tax=unclassified Streptomyces TaxID=2593676 RepID=UPI003674B0F0
MREFIALLSFVPAAAGLWYLINPRPKPKPRRPGRHSAEFLAAARPEPHRFCVHHMDVTVPAHVLARTIRPRPDDLDPIRPYYRAWENDPSHRARLRVIRERQRALVRASVGALDWPVYRYENDQFAAVAKGATA